MHLARGWVNHGVIFIFGWTIPLIQDIKIYLEEKQVFYSQNNNLRRQSLNVLTI